MFLTNKIPRRYTKTKVFKNCKYLLTQFMKELNFFHFQVDFDATSISEQTAYNSAFLLIPQFPAPLSSSLSNFRVFVPGFIVFRRGSLIIFARVSDIQRRSIWTTSDFFCSFRRKNAHDDKLWKISRYPRSI